MREAMTFIERERLFGLGCGLVDVLLLASTLMTPGVELWTLDKRLCALAERFGVSQVTVVTMLKRLKSDGLFDKSPRNQDAPRRDDAFRARRARRRHRMVYQFLLALGADERTAAIDAEEIQPHVSERAIVRLKEFFED